MNSKTLRQKCEVEWKAMLQGQQLGEALVKDSAILNRNVQKGVLISAPALPAQIKGSRASSKETGTSWGLSSNKKNEPSDAYTWGTIGPISTT